MPALVRARRSRLLSRLAVLGVLALASPGRARADFEVGGFLGAHFFAADNQLGRDENAPGNLAPQHMALLGARLSWQPIPRLALELEAAFIPSYTRGGTQPFTPVLSYRGSLRVNVLTGRTRPFVLLGGGAHSLFSSDSSVVHDATDGYLHAGVGWEIDLGDRFGVRAEARIYFVPAVAGAPFTNDFELLVGFYGKFEARRRAGGVGAVGESAGAASRGKRAARPAASRRAEPEGGHVETARARGDGGGDADRDGTLDRDDRCPDVAGPRENRGCPDVDQDGDGIVDRLDRCPDQPETVNGWRDDDGCPDQLPPEVARFEGVVEGIQFHANSAELVKSSLPVLDEAARMMQDHPELKFEISGHTDTSGNAERNTQLSQARAEAVRDYLVTKGISAARLHAIGRGSSRPAADNATLAGRAKNRRVEFHLAP